MAPKPKPKSKTEEKGSRQEGKLQPANVKGVADEAPVPRDGSAPENLPFVSPLPLVTGKEVVSPLQQGENQFVSIANGPPIAYHIHKDAREQQLPHGQETRSTENDRGAPSNLKPPLDDQSLQQPQQPQQQIIQIQHRIQRIENVFDSPLVPPSPLAFQRYGGSSYDCYCREELDHQHELCENCKEIWRRWPVRLPPPPEIDPYENFLCVGDIDPHFEPARGDIVIYHPSGPQSNAGLRTGWGFLSSYKGPGDLRLHPNDLVVRLGSFSDSQNVVDYIPYDRVEVRARTQSLEWRFLGGQVGLIRKPRTEPPGAMILQPVPVEDGKDGKRGKKGKKDKKKGEKKGQGTASEQDSPRKEKQPDKAKAKEGEKDKKNRKGKKGRKGGQKEDETEGQKEGGEVPEFTLDEIPDVFNIIPKMPDTVAPHPGEKALQSHNPSLTCNYRYNKPGMQCGKGELVPQFGDVIIHEPQAWIHEDWGDRKKRPKGSMVKWYKPSPWRREFRKGMILLRPYIDRDIRLDVIPQCPYTPMMWSQWGGAEMYVFEGRVASKVSESPPTSKELDNEASKSPDSEAVKDNGLAKSKFLGSKDRKRDQKQEQKKLKKGDKTKDAEVPKSGEGRGDKAEAADGKALKAGDKKLKAGKENPKSSRKDIENREHEEAKTSPDTNIIEDGLWTYWGRSTHIFDRPFKVGALDELCPQRHQAEARNVVHLDFFVEDTGAESDDEHAPKVKNDLPSIDGEELKGKKGKATGKKGKKAPDDLKDSKQPKKKIK